MLATFRNRSGYFATVAGFAALGLQSLKEVNMPWLIASIVPVIVIASLPAPSAGKAQGNLFLFLHYMIIVVATAIWFGAVLGGEVVRVGGPTALATRAVDLAAEQKAPFRERDRKDWSALVNSAAPHSAWLAVKGTGPVVGVGFDRSLKTLLEEWTSYVGWCGLGTIMLLAIAAIANFYSAAIDTRRDLR